MHPEVRLHVRSLSPTAAGGRVREVVARLAALDEAGTVADYEVTVTGRELPPAPRHPTGTGATLRRRLERFRSWASERDAELVGVRERSTPRGPAVVLPALQLAAYRGDELRTVAPVDHGDATRTVVDALDALSDGRTPPAVAD